MQGPVCLVLEAEETGFVRLRVPLKAASRDDLFSCSSTTTALPTTHQVAITGKLANKVQFPQYKDASRALRKASGASLSGLHASSYINIYLEFLTPAYMYFAM